MTAPSIDAEGDGWLRLTETGWQNGIAVYEKTFSSADGMQITFDYVTASGAAYALAFFLVDGNASVAIGAPPAGHPSDRLGYTAITDRYVGIALDTQGEFGYTCGNPISCRKPQSVTVRGVVPPNSPLAPLHSVDLSDVAMFPTLLGRVGRSSRTDARTARITLSPVSPPAAPYPTLTVEIDPTGTGQGFVTVINALDLSSNGPVPATFKLGFIAQTAGSGGNYEVRIKRKAIPVPALGQGTLGVLVVVLMLLTVPALRRRFRN
ncbi:MAG: hypothetical protein LBP52_03525 [Burkholderiaceae bacterium]|nr:hypothetical protein [Burkholderiaceae bacterium]